MSIKKYKKSTPDVTIPNSAWLSTDNSNLRGYKLVNAQDIGLEWCYATNYNNKKRYDKTYINVGDKTLETAKTGLYAESIEQTTLYDVSMYKVNIVDDNFEWDKVGAGISVGLLHVDSISTGTNANYKYLYVIENLDYSKIFVTAAGYSTGLGTWSIDTTDGERISTNGMYVSVRAFDKVSKTLKDLPSGLNLRLFFGTASSDFTFIDRLGCDAATEPMIQVGSRWFTYGYSAYTNTIFEKPYKTNIGYNLAYCMETDDKYVQTVVLPLNDFAKFTEKVVWHSQYGDTYGGFFTEGPNCDDIIKAMNSTGLYYADSLVTTWSDFSKNVHLGVMDKYGVTDCEKRITGLDEIEASDLPNKDRSGYDWTLPDPTRPPSPDPSGDDYPNLSLDVIGATGIATGVSWFVMNDTDMATLSKLGVYHADPTVIETPWETINKANAVSKASEDAIISILQFPYDISTMHSAEGRHGTIRVYVPGVFNSDSEWFGASECYTGAMGGYITDLNRIINAGSATVTTRGGAPTFLDFEPYTSLQMYVPFAGWISLPCSQCMGATVALQYVIDPPTGSGRAFISANGCIIRDIPFTIGNVTPTSVHQTGPLMGPLLNTAFGVAGTIAGAAVAAETGGLSATMGASMAVGAVSNLSNTLMDSCVPKTQTIGTNGTAITSFPTPKTPVILINRPRVKIPDNMGHRYGYACDKEAVLSDLSGMTVCSNVDTSGINATANEKARLKATLESGFYA